MLKRLKTVSMMLFLMGTSTGAAFAISTPGADDVKITQQSETATGTVVDAMGPVIGASVVEKGTTNGTITDFDGNFSLSGVKKGAVLEISFIGYATKEVVWEGKALNVTLAEDTQQLQEVVVTALGIKKDAKKLGYAVATVSSADLVKGGATNFATSLYGKASGVRIQAAPGGSTSAVSINVRGLSSITGSNQPLLIIDGVPVRNGDANNTDYWGSQRTQSNGLVDINPEDIESLSILKGASASALYGSEAANGVVMITTKSGKGQKGIGVDINASVSADFIAYMPEYQTTFGPGVANSQWGSYTNMIANNGFYERTVNGQTVKSVMTATGQWGPRYDGSDIYYYDGTMRKYSPVTSNPWTDAFRTGFNQTYGLAVTQGNDKGNMRLSYTYVDNMPTQYNSDFAKHNFQLNGSYKLNDALKVDYTATYIRQDIQNRPYRISRLTNNFSGMFSAFDDVEWLRKHAVTSLGYMNVSPGGQTLTPDETPAWAPGCWSGLIDEYYWNIYGKSQEELNQRFMASVTPTWTIMPGLTLRGRLSTDLTNERIELKEKNTKPLMYGNSGNYSLTNSNYEIYYGDIMLMFDKQVTEKLGIQANAGWQGRQESYRLSTAQTRDGLSVENWFHLNSSVSKTNNASMSTTEYLKTAFLGTISLSWDTWAYLEGTARQEKTSTLSSGNNSFFYPSVSGSVIFTELFREKLPEWYQYGKVRASYGIVGNAPAVYRANQAYTQSAASGFIYNQIPSSLGNEAIQPEEKTEFEIGLESKFFNNRLGFEVSYYKNVVKDQILQTTTPTSAGGSSILLNVGELENSGLEVSLYGTPIETKDWRWSLNANLSFNKNKVNKLMDGVDVLVHSDLDGGAARIESHVGESMGDIYAYDFARDAKGNKIVTSEGYYKLTDERVKVGNAMPKLTGGFTSSLSYKNFSLDAVIDFRIGGSVINIPYQYMMNRGSLVQSLYGRGTENGGLSYYFENVDNTGKLIACDVNTAKGPNGQNVYDNGMILDGVKEDGSKNDIMIESAKYYQNVYGWGTSTVRTYAPSIFDNTYVKLRELTFSYALPSSICEKFACNRLSLSVFGRNLFYFHKNMPAFDAEATDGTNWVYQAQIGGATATTRSFGFSLRASF